MTTISNFLHHSFLTVSQQPSTPIWSLSFSEHNFQPIKQYLINYCISQNKPLIHLDLGISTIKLISSYQPVHHTDKFSFYQITNDGCYIIVRPSLNYKVSQAFFSTVVSSFNKSLQSEGLKALLKGYHKIGLLIQGIQTAYNLSKQSQSLQYFLSELANISKQIGQITVIALEKLLPYQGLFILERTSACVTKILKNKQQNVFECVSTVRRITGYSNEQIYIINLKDTKAKISKETKLKDEKSTQQHQEMVKSLGFTVGNKATLQTQSNINIKKMIYPHLNVQTVDKKQNCEDCACKDDEGLIILDDEQEDDDDVDI